jgi:hypothetical protein
MLSWKVMLLFFAALSVLPGSLDGRTLQVLERQDVTVMAEEPLKGAAEEALELYPGVKGDLEARLGLEVAFIPSILLIRDTQAFRQMAGSDFVVAFAVPEEKLMVIDHSRMTLSPFSLAITMKHELCHLLLHQYLKGRRIPRWFEEGIAQWVSEGIGEMIMDYKRPLLNEAFLAGKIIPMRALSDFFPADRESLSLAYEQSRSFVSYMVDRHGLESILNILEAVREGNAWEDAVWGALGISFLDLEDGWRNHMRKRLTWLTYLVNHLYQILFFLAAVASIIGFARAYRRKRAYMREMEEEDDEFMRQ